MVSFESLEVGTFFKYATVPYIKTNGKYNNAVRIEDGREIKFVGYEGCVIIDDISMKIVRFILEE